MIGAVIRAETEHLGNRVSYHRKRHVVIAATGLHILLRQKTRQDSQGQGPA